MNFQKCCRLCTQEGDKVLVNLLENQEMKKSIEKLFPIEIHENQTITTLICVDCFREVIDIKKSLEVYESKKSAILLHDTLLKAQASSVSELIEVKRENEEGPSNTQTPTKSSQEICRPENRRISETKVTTHTIKSPAIKINLTKNTVTQVTPSKTTNQTKTQINERKRGAPENVFSVPKMTQNSSPKVVSPVKIITESDNSAIVVRRTERKRKPPAHFEIDDINDAPKKTKKADTSSNQAKSPMVVLENVSLKRFSTGEVLSSGQTMLKQYSRKSDLMKQNDNEAVPKNSLPSPIPNVIKQTKITRASPSTSVTSSTPSSTTTRDDLPINHVISIKNLDSQNKSYKLVKSSDGNPNIKYKLTLVKNSDMQGATRSESPTNSPQLTIRSVRSINSSATSTPTGQIQKIVLARPKSGKGNFIKISDDDQLPTNVTKTVKK